jgi:hypothetical protein
MLNFGDKMTTRIIKKIIRDEEKFQKENNNLGLNESMVSFLGDANILERIAYFFIDREYFVNLKRDMTRRLNELRSKGVLRELENEKMDEVKK